MTSPHHGAHALGSPGGRETAGAGPAGDPAPPPSTDTGMTDAGVTDTGVTDAVHEVEVEAEDRPPAAGTTSNLVIAVVVLAFGVAAFAGSWALGAGTAQRPAAGTFPLLVSGVLVLLGLGLLAGVRRTSDAERFTAGSWQVLAGLATMVVFVALISVIGFEIPAALLAFVWLRVLGHESWRLSIITSLAVVVAFYLLFVAALSVPIPHLF
ncbi:tripartite tricarboxylate transporter TctB family protein [uncultured Modestobacter sp.]|uniref:tripartite tricarboxylate transporter TctB family protein n=1 Tax=uncultured Modestobacter sp. TaxID=380048 RepID=UPI00261CC334|nr:tripartite tricarboxylate transporter TctB family protein [uncultured Modestobacter sp.]